MRVLMEAILLHTHCTCRQLGLEGPQVHHRMAATLGMVLLNTQCICRQVVIGGPQLHHRMAATLGGRRLKHRMTTTTTFPGNQDTQHSVNSSRAGCL